MKADQGINSMTTAQNNQPVKITDARTAAREYLAQAATSTATSNQPPAIPKNTVAASDYSIQNNCRASLLKFFDEHEPENLEPKASPPTAKR